MAGMCRWNSYSHHRSDLILLASGRLQVRLLSPKVHTGDFQSAQVDLAKVCLGVHHPFHSDEV